MKQHQTIRVFISSTFRDMHSERDYLVKFIFPELRERCLRKGIHLVDIDLRWGVTEKEAEEGKALAICLDEIEHCRPFFIGILGERYGWTPEQYDVPDYERYDWLKSIDKGHSITALEIYQGVLNNPQMQARAFFYFRDPDFIKNVPVAKQAEITSESSQSAQKLDLLKEKIRFSFTENQASSHITEGYKCSYKGLKIQWAQVKADQKAGISPEDIDQLDRLTHKNNLISTEEYNRLNQSQKEIVERYGVVYLNGLEGFGEKVLDQIWQAIEDEYPANETETDPLRIENKYHENFIAQLTRFFIGREDTLNEISRYILDKDCRPLFMSGEAGSGKSALLAKASLIFRAENPDAISIARFIGASPASLNITKLIKNIIQELGIQLGFTPDESRWNEHDTLWKYFNEVLYQKTSSKKVFISIDGVNQLNPHTSPQLLTWLPKALPSNVKIVVSSLEGEYTHTANYFDLPFIIAGKLNKTTSREIIVRKLGASRKSLSEQQMLSLLGKEEASKPLYLSIACEELRTFPLFEEIDNLISGLPPIVPQLFEQVLDRLEKDHGHKLVKDAFCFLESSIQGLSEDELLDLLKREDEDKLPANIWARLFRNIAPYLNNAGENKEGLLNFFHQQLSIAVQLRYLQNKDEKINYCVKLADYGYVSHKRFPGTVTNCLRYTGIYIYNAGDAEALRSLFEYFFSSAQYAPVYEIIFEELLDFVSDYYDPAKEVLLLTIIKSVRVEQMNDNAIFLRGKGLQYKNTGKSNWSLECLKAASEAMEQLSLSVPGIVNYRQALASILNETGIVMLNMGMKDHAETCFEKSTKVMEELVNMAPHLQEFQRELSVNFNNSGKKYLAEGKPDEALLMFEKSLNIREILLKEEPDSTSLLLDMAVSYSNIGNVFQQLERWNEAENYYNKDLEKMKALLISDPDNVEYAREASITLDRLAAIYFKKGNLQKATAFSTNSIEMMEQALTYAPSRTDLQSVLANKINSLGVTYQELNSNEKALELYTKGLKIREKLVKKEPERADFRLELASNQWKIYQVSSAKDALGWLEETYNTLQPLKEMETAEIRKNEITMLVNRDLGMVYSSMANNLYKRDRFPEAIHFYEKSNSLLEALDTSAPGYDETVKALLKNHTSLADIFSRLSATEKAIDCYIKAENILAGVILKIDPENTDMQFTQATIYSRAGELYMETKDFDNTIRLLSNAIRIYGKLLGENADNTELLLNLSMDYYRVGAIYAEIGQTQEAYTGFLNAAFFRQKLHNSDPENVDHWINLAVLYWNIFGFCPPDEKEMWLNRAKETIQAILQSGSVEDNVLELDNMITNELKKRE